MGMFDRLWLDCPKCGEQTEFQSKYGPCTLADFNLENAPLLVVADANRDGKDGRLFCDHCKAQLMVTIRFAATVHLVGEAAPELREE